MRIDIVAEKLKLNPRYKAKIVSRFNNALEKYLHHVPADLKGATLNIKKNIRLGYELRFDAHLPWGHADTQITHPKLFTGLLRLRDNAKKIIKKDLDKIKSSRH